VIGTNAKSELGLGDNNSRKSFVAVDEIADKQIENIAVGKSGFIVAIGLLQGEG
jgi:hypothetical protein